MMRKHELDMGRRPTGHMAEKRDLGWLGLLVVLAWAAGCVGAVVAFGWIVTVGLWIGMTGACAMVDAFVDKRSRWALAKLAGGSILLALAVLLIKGGL